MRLVSSASQWLVDMVRLWSYSHVEYSKSVSHSYKHGGTIANGEGDGDNKRHWEV